MKAESKTADRMELENLISKHPLFSGMDRRQIEWLADLAMETEFATGQPIFKQGDPANRFYLILNGSVSLTLESGNRRAVPVREIVAGENLGWSWLFEPYIFYASAQALEPTRAIFFYGTLLREKCDEDKSFGYEIMNRVTKDVIQSFVTLQNRLI